MSFHPTILKLRKCFLLLLASLAFGTVTGAAELWTTAYYPGYRQSAMPASKVDFTAMTHVIHFALLPNADGTLNSSANTVTLNNSFDLVTRAHAAGKKVLICVGGSGSSFFNATTSTNIVKFTTNLVNFMVTRGYDGIDVDWEPIATSEVTQFKAFINGLRTELNKITPRPLMTAAIATQPAVIASLQHQFDQLNIMTYDIAGTWDGWVTWFNSPIFNGGYRFPSTGGLIPSTDGMVNTFTNAGVPIGKLGIGIAFYGCIWTGGGGTTTGGAALPRQSWTNDPVTSYVSYSTVMSTYYQTNLYHWDTNAQSAYLSIDKAGSTNDQFISFDDERACQSKVSYARNRGLGGVMIWELGEAYRSTQPVGKQDPLLQAVKKALATPRVTGVVRSNQTINLSFTSAPLGTYRVQWTTNLASTNWNTLTTNLSGIDGVLQVSDPAVVSQSQRFYRIKTPP